MSERSTWSWSDTRTPQELIARLRPRSSCARARLIPLQLWAKRLGFRSSRSIELVLQGKRLPASTMIHALAREAKLEVDAQRFLELLVTRERLKRRKNLEPRILQAVEGKLAELRAREFARQYLEQDLFRHFAEWHHLAILQLIRAPGFDADPKWISRRLADRISPTVVRESLENLAKLGLIEKTEHSWRRSEGRPFYIEADVPSLAIRKHHQGMMERALQALHDDPVEEREFRSLTFVASPERFSEFRKRLRALIDEFNSKLPTVGSSGEVYQLNAQLFSLTRSEHRTLKRRKETR